MGTSSIRSMARLAAAAAYLFCAGAQAKTEDSLVLITSDVGTGTGFLCSMEGKDYILSNAHVIENSTNLEFRTLGGQTLSPAGLELAATHDLVRLRCAAGEAPTLKLAATAASIDDTVFVYGNSMGAGVVTRLEGKVLGVGPDKIEIGAEFVSGNSGSPIVTASGCVVAVATYVIVPTAPEKTAKGTRFDKKRRFGIRLHNGIVWTNVPPKVFQQQSGLLGDIRLLYRDLSELGAQIEGIKEPRESIAHWRSVYAFYQLLSSAAQTDAFRKRYRDPEFPRLIHTYTRGRAGMLDSLMSGKSAASGSTKINAAFAGNAGRQFTSSSMKKINAVRWCTPFYADQAKQMLDDLKAWEDRSKAMK